MTAFPRCLHLIFVQSLRSLLWSKKAAFFAMGSVFYAGMVTLFIALAGDRENHNELFCGTTLGIFWQALVPLTVMFFSISAVREEIATRTLVFLVSGPVPRSAIWLGKFLASTVASALILALGYGLATLSATQAGGDQWERIAQSTVEAPAVPLLLAAPAYAAIGTLLAVWFKRPMIAGAIYVIGWEELVGASPGQAKVRALTVVDSVRTLFYHRVPAAPDFRRAMEQWRAAGQDDVPMPSASDALTNLMWLTGIALVLALVVGARKDYDTAPKE